VIGISAVLLDLDVFIITTATPITLTIPIVIITTFSYLKRV